MTADLLGLDEHRSMVTVCPFCGSGCSVLLCDGAAYPRRAHAVSEGALCLRGWSAGELRDSPLRIGTAYARRRGEPLRAAAVEAALDGVAERLRAIRDTHGAGAIGVLGSARITLEEAVLLRRLAAAIGTPHLDTLQRIGYVPFPAVPLEAIERAEKVTVLGANLTVRQPQAGRRLLRAIDRGARVRYVHARKVQLAALGARHDAALPGQELAVLGALEPDELVLLSSELAMSGQGAEAARRLRGHRTLFLTDYANQRGVLEAGMLPAADGLSAFEMLQAAACGHLRALLVFADDPFEFFPALAGQAFERLELAVVADAVKSRTARHADVVLPGALPAEKHGTFVNTEGRAQELSATAPPFGGWTEGGLATALIERLGGDRPLPRAAAFVPGEGGVEAEAPDAGHPFVVALDTTVFWSTHALIGATVTAWREARGVFADFPPGFVTLSPDDASALGVPYGQPVTLTSREGSVTLPARHHPRVLPGSAWIAMPCWERCGRPLGALAFDESLRIPVFRPRAVRIERAGTR